MSVPDGRASGQATAAPDGALGAPRAASVSFTRDSSSDMSSSDTPSLCMTIRIKGSRNMQAIVRVLIVVVHIVATVPVNTVSV